jgi:hypothetical protein
VKFSFLGDERLRAIGHLDEMPQLASRQDVGVRLDFFASWTIKLVTRTIEGKTCAE